MGHHDQAAWPVAEITTSRLVIRPWRAEDGPALRACLRDSRDHLAPWIELPDVTTVEAATAVAAGLGAELEAGRRFLYAVVARRDGRLVGSVGLEPVARRDALELSYWLGAGAVGQGLASEAARALVAAASAAGWTAFELRCRRDNRRSARLAARLGFREQARTGGLALWTLTRGGDDMDGSGMTRDIDEWAAAEARMRALAAELDAEQPVELCLVDAGGRPWLVATAALGGDDLFAARDALRHNAFLAVGALCLTGGRMALRHAGRPEAVTAPELRLLAHEAARLRGLVGGRRIDDVQEIFAAYAA